jgi:hypothetical protein
MEKFDPRAFKRARERPACAPSGDRERAAWAGILQACRGDVDAARMLKEVDAMLKAPV